MLSYLFPKLNKITEKQKGKIKQKKEKDLPGAQARGAHPAQPAQPTWPRLSSSPPTPEQAAAAVASMPALPGHLQPFRGLFSRPGDVSQPPRPFPSLQRDSFLLLRRFLPPPESVAARLRKNSRPSTSRSQAKVSKRFAIAVFIDRQKESEPNASPSSLASSFSSPAAVDRVQIPASSELPRAH